ncbi:cytochrome c1 [Bartonella sp. TP]|uniref:cytochrome c1 n=1 Tax=Bartonella sp. TP TaxID=3057550 RepID=UPI0025AFC1B0|nr:cytochrome c1 [Bartonella sp. TP]WJW79699.1 cytochrome c1 [Bartonella sp. TP]
MVNLLTKLVLFAFVSFGTNNIAHATTYPLKAPKSYAWSFNSIFGVYDKAQLQRGLQIYKQICSSCHSLHYVAIDNLSEIGYSKQQILLLAKEYKLNGHFPDPFPNEVTARAANNGAMPPDLSNIVNVRSKANFSYASGADYVASLLTGYTSKGSEFINPYYYKSDRINMPPPLIDGAINYADGTPQITEQYAQDIAAFLYWCANPHIIERKQLGFCVISFLFVVLLLLYALKQDFYKQLSSPTNNKGKTYENK